MNISPFPSTLTAIPMAILILTCACSKPALRPGESMVVCTFADSGTMFKSPEGIAMDQKGNLYVSLRTLEGTMFIKNEIIRIRPKGDQSTLADLGPTGQFQGALGLAVDEIGNVYVAFAAGEEKRGVYKIGQDGMAERIPGSERIHIPNALTFDERGNLYVTDCYPAAPDLPGAVWRCRPDGSFAEWVTDPLLAPDPVADPVSPPPPAEPYAAPGANGIVFVPPHDLYVANTEKCLILQIRIPDDGSAGEVTVVAGSYPPVGPPGPLFAPDGLAADTSGMLYTVLPPAGFTGPDFPLSPVLRINPATGEIVPVIPPLTEPSPFFAFPTSLAVGVRPGESERIFVINMTGRSLGMAVGSGAKVTAVGL